MKYRMNYENYLKTSFSFERTRRFEISFKLRTKNNYEFQTLLYLIIKILGFNNNN